MVRQGGRGEEIPLTSLFPAFCSPDSASYSQNPLKAKEQRHLDDAVHGSQLLGHNARWTGHGSGWVDWEGQRKYTQPLTSYPLANSLRGGSGLFFYAELSFMEPRLLQQDSKCRETNLLNWSEKSQHCAAGWVFCYSCCILIRALREGEPYVPLHSSLCSRPRGYIWTYNFIIS